jgi:predicted dehydrogenase
MDQTGIGIIGLDHWYWALGCAYAIGVTPEATLVAIADQDGAWALEVAGVYGAERCYADYKELLADPEVDAVLITTTTAMQDEVGVACARAGKHILIGKPISRTLRGADAILQAVEANGVRMMALAAGPRPGDPIKTLIDEGAIGRPYAVYDSIRAIPPLRAPGIDEPGWFADPHQAAGGAFIDHAIYAVGVLRKYFDSEVVSVYAEMAKFVLTDWEVEDYGIAFLRFQNGAIATVESTFGGTIQTVSAMVVTGTEGEIEQKGGQLSILGKNPPYQNVHTVEFLAPNAVYKTFGEISVPEPPYAGGYKPVIEDFIQRVNTGQEFVNTGEDARAGLEACLAAYQSAAIGAPVRLPLADDVDVPAILAQL